MHDGKCAKTLGITKEEAKIVLALMRATIPITFGMVEQNAIDAFIKGYVLFSEKSGTKRWFESVVREKTKGTKDIEKVIKRRKFMEAIDISSAARNCSIQGLQSDMLKRALRLLRERIKALNLPCKIVGHVHDEIHVVYPDYMSTLGKKWNKKTEEWETTYDCPYIGNLVKDTMREAANFYLNTDIIEMDSASELYNVLKK